MILHLYNFIIIYYIPASMNTCDYNYIRANSETLACMRMKV